jgi:hypothetical protein
VFRKETDLYGRREAKVRLGKEQVTKYRVFQKSLPSLVDYII